MKTLEHFLLNEEFRVKKNPNHLEVVPENFRKPRVAGTAIEHRDNPEKHHGDEQVRNILSNPKKNTVLRSADSYTRQHLGKRYEYQDAKPVSSLRKQYVIGKTYELATSHHPEYKKAVFNDYAENRPDIVKQTRAHDYDSLVAGSYRRLGKETQQQFNHMPVKMQFHDGHMNYHNSGEMLRDVHLHNNLTVFRGGDRHEFLHHTDRQTGLNENEKFRAVHDYYGHGIHGNSFGSKGEEVAWHSHKKMFSEGASVAMTSETRGQNSWVNFSHANLDTMKTMEGHRKEKRAALNRGDLTAARHADEKLRSAGDKWNYAKQSAVALPSAMLKPDFDGHAPAHIAHLLRDKLASRHNGVYDVDKDHLRLTELARHHNTKSHMALQGGGTLDKENAHEDLKHVAAVHGYHTLSRNPFK